MDDWALLAAHQPEKWWGWEACVPAAVLNRFGPPTIDEDLSVDMPRQGRP